MNASQGKDARRSHRALESRQPANVLSTEIWSRIQERAARELARPRQMFLPGDHPRVVADRRGRETTILFQLADVFERKPHVVQGCFIALCQRFVGRAQSAFAHSRREISDRIASRLIRCSVAMSSPLVQVV